MPPGHNPIWEGPRVLPFASCWRVPPLCCCHYHGCCHCCCHTSVSSKASFSLPTGDWRRVTFQESSRPYASDWDCWGNQAHTLSRLPESQPSEWKQPLLNVFIPLVLFFQRTLIMYRLSKKSIKPLHLFTYFPWNLTLKLERQHQLSDFI